MWPLVRALSAGGGVSVGHFLVGLSGPFPGADLPRVCATRGGAVRDGLAEGEVTASRREASCVLGMSSSLGVKAPCAT